MELFLSDKKGYFMIIGGCDEHITVSLEQYNDELYTIRLEQFETGKEGLQTIEHLMDSGDLDELAEMINRVRK